MVKVSDEKILRIMDVNLNRLREGLRVCEEIIRFVLDDSSLTSELKYIRHKIDRIAWSSAIDRHLLCASRDVKGDVGARVDPLERKADWQSIFFANMQRAKESLRVLEEFFKLCDDSASKKFKRLRFKVYEFETKALKRSKILSYNKRNS